MPRPLRWSAGLLGGVGRRQLAARAGDGIAPILSAAARVHRRTWARSTRVVAVVGSAGKTTTTRALRAALAVPGRHIGLNSAAWVAAGLLRTRRGQRHAVLEVGIAGPGEMTRRARMVRPDVAVVTSVGSDHHRALKSLDGVRHEKAEMVRALPASGLAVLNGDDPNVAWMAGETRARVRTFGLGEGNDVRATGIALDWPRGTRFRLVTPWGTREASLRLIGRVMVRAALAAVAVALEEGGHALDAVLERLAGLEPTPGRLQPERLPGGAVILHDEFKASEESVDAALDVLAEIPARRRIVVMGSVDEPAGPPRTLYRRLGRRIAESATSTLVLAGTEDFEALRSGARAGGLRAESVARVRTVRAAVERLGGLGDGDVVLLKGRNTQRIQRVALALAGRDVRCDLTYCNARLLDCGTCPMLGRAWAGVWVDGPASRPQGAGGTRVGHSKERAWTRSD